MRHKTVMTLKMNLHLLNFVEMRIVTVNLSVFVYFLALQAAEWRPRDLTVDICKSKGESQVCMQNYAPSFYNGCHWL